jgi:uncharacterized protein (DUF433 family)
MTLAKAPLYHATAHILQLSNVCDGLPFINGTTITVVDVYEAYQVLGLSAEQIMGRYELNPVQAFSALTFVHERMADVERLYEKRRVRSLNPLK